MSITAGQSSWPPEPTWENARRIVGNSLDWYDQWCPDDGRVRKGFDIVDRHMRSETRDDALWFDVMQAGLEVGQAIEMVSKSLETAKRAKDGKPRWDDPVVIALNVARAVKCLLIPIIARVPDYTTHYARAISFGGLANLGAAIGLPEIWDARDKAREED